MEDTICAIATLVGESSINVIRISGKESINIVNKIFSKDISNVPSHTVHYGFVMENKETLADLRLQIDAADDKVLAALAELAMADKDNIVSNKIFTGLAEGRVSKQLKEICLLDQTYVKAEDGKQTVAKYLESVDKDLVIDQFVRFEVGEGMEKKNEDFAAEVAKQMGQ